MEVSFGTAEQPAPIASSSKPSWELVIQDMKNRDQVGRQRYGVPLQAGNGRDSLVDAYQEALDLVVYLRTEIENRRLVQESLRALYPDVPNSKDDRLPRYRTAEGWRLFRTLDGVTIQSLQDDGNWTPAQRYHSWQACESDPDTYECDANRNRLKFEHPGKIAPK